MLNFDVIYRYDIFMDFFFEKEFKEIKIDVLL